MTLVNPDAGITKIVERADFINKDVKSEVQKIEMSGCSGSTQIDIRAIP
jgi:hypothetical protein